LLTAIKLDEGRGSAILFPSALAFGGIISDGTRMPETLERVAAPKPSTPRSVFLFRFGSTIVLWSLALGIIFSGYEIAFFALIGTLGMLSLWEFYGMLDHKGLPNFKITAMICGAVMLCGSFYYFSRIGPGHSYDFEVAVLLFFLLTVFEDHLIAERSRSILKSIPGQLATSARKCHAEIRRTPTRPMGSNHLTRFRAGQKISLYALTLALPIL